MSHPITNATQPGQTQQDCLHFIHYKEERVCVSVCVCVCVCLSVYVCVCSKYQLLAPV